MKNTQEFRIIKLSVTLRQACFDYTPTARPQEAMASNAQNYRTYKMARLRGAGVKIYCFQSYL